MSACLILLLHVVISPFKTKARLEAEIIMLRHQLNVLRRRVPPKPKLGIEVAQSTVAKYMARRGRGWSQTWKTFLHNHTAGIGAMDFLIVPTVGFRLLLVLVILRHQRRRPISLNVTAHPTAEWIARQITEPSHGTKRQTI